MERKKLKMYGVSKISLTDRCSKIEKYGQKRNRVSN